MFWPKNKSFDRNWPDNNHFEILFITFKYSKCQFVVKNDILTGHSRSYCGYVYAMAVFKDDKLNIAEWGALQCVKWKDYRNLRIFDCIKSRHFLIDFFTNNQIKWDLWDSVVCLNQWAEVSSNVKIGETVLVHFFIRYKSDLRYAVYHTSQRKNGRTMGPRYRKGRFKHIYSYEWQLTKDIVILCIHHILDLIQWDSNCMSHAT